MSTTRKQTVVKQAKSLMIALGLTMAATSANAAVWMHPYMGMVSDTCVAPNGAFFTFTNGNFGPVGAGCSFTLLNAPGVVFYGAFH